MAFQIWKWQEPNRDILKGKLVAKLNNMPPYGKKLYGVELDNGEVWYVWGTTVLVGMLAPIPFLSKIKLRFLGKGMEKPDDNFPKMLFELEVLDVGRKTKKSVALEKKLSKIKK